MTFDSGRALDEFLSGARTAPMTAVVAPTPIPEDADETGTGTTGGFSPFTPPRSAERIDRGSNTLTTDDDHLVTLHAGKLSVLTGGSSPELVAQVHLDAMHVARFDKVLVRGDQVLVFGYSHHLESKLVVHFTRRADGSLHHDSSHAIRASGSDARENTLQGLVGEQLVFSVSHPLQRGWSDPTLAAGNVPSTCTLARGRCNRWTPIIDPTDIVATGIESNTPTLHAMVLCDLQSAAAELSCTGRGVAAGPAAIPLLAPDAFYVWVDNPRWVAPPPWADASLRSDVNAMVFRYSLQTDDVAGLRTFGSPVTKEALAVTPDGHLNLALRGMTDEEQLYLTRRGLGMDMAALRVPLERFEPGMLHGTTAKDYRDLPETPGADITARVIGDNIVYVTTRPFQRRGEQGFYVHDLSSGETTELDVEHTIQNVLPVPGGLLIVGGAGGTLSLSAVSLGARPTIGNPLELRDLHGVRPWRLARVVNVDPHRVQVSVTSVVRHGASVEAKAHLIELRNRELASLGMLSASSGEQDPKLCNDRCLETWFDNALTTVDGDSVSVLLGPELIEAVLRGNLLTPRRRTRLEP